MSLNTNTPPKEFLNYLYLLIQTENDKVPRYQHLHDILQIKNKHSELRDVGQSMYQDAKEFVVEYIKHIQSSGLDAGYDTINVQKLTGVGDMFNGIEREQLTNLTIRELEGNGYHDEAEEIKEGYKQKLIIRKHLHSGSALGIAKGVCVLATNNLWACLIAIFIVLCVHCLLLLPCSSPDHALFVIEYNPYSEHSFWNHVLNFMASFIEINDVVFYRATGFGGVAVILIFKAFYAVFISNFLLDLIKRIKL